jgi:diaminopimelate decarboxylase
MNDLIRPALYHSYHAVVPVQVDEKNPQKTYNVVGPVCESGDFLALERQLATAAGELLVIKDCGAYGMSMSSNYNTRPRCAEILVSGDKSYVIRERETLPQLVQGENSLDARLILR